MSKKTWIAIAVALLGALATYLKSLPVESAPAQPAAASADAGVGQ